LNPNNIFLSESGEVKIGDFGLSKLVHDVRSKSSSENLNNSFPNYWSRDDTRGVGTPLYIAPEQKSSSQHSQKVDVYSLGIIFFELLFPFSTEYERITVLTKLRDGKFPDGFVESNTEEAEFIEWLMNPDPNKRPTSREIRYSKNVQNVKNNPNRPAK